MSKLSKRIVSGLTGAAFALIILFFNQNYPWIINLITSTISVLAIKEILSLIGISKNYTISIPTLIFVPMLPLFGYSVGWELIFYVYTIIVFSALMLNKSLKINDIFTLYAMSIIISFSFFKIVDLRDYGNQYGTFYVFLSLVIAWMSDTGAYFCGKYLGKNKLCPDISPKKTIEGFIGGIVVCLICVSLITAVFNNYLFYEKQQINYLLILLLGLTGSVISCLGDLCFSMIKRRYQIKDFGNLMPGHGGVLDRFDSIIFVVPYVYIFLKLIPIIF